MEYNQKLKLLVDGKWTDSSQRDTLPVIDPATEKMHFQLIRVIDQMRMLDQDLIRLQQKVDVVLEYRENEKKKSRQNEE